jgi:lipoprotein-releasing system permease protein
MGADRAGIRKVFLTFGLIIGLVGATLGVGAGMAFLWRLEDVRAAVSHATGFDPFPAKLYYFTEIPKEYDAGRYLRIWLAAVGVCLIAAVYPAARAARLNPVEIIRYE